MADNKGVQGTARGGISATPFGVGDDAPSERVLGLEPMSDPPPQPSLPETRTDVLEYTLVTGGQCEVGLYRTAGRMSYDKTLAALRQQYHDTAVNAFVEMGVAINFLRRRQDLGKDEKFQAYMYIEVGGPFLPNELTKDPVKLKRVTTPAAGEDTKKVWEQVRTRLEDHEKGHIKDAMEGFLKTLDEYRMARYTKYDEFENYLKATAGEWNNSKVVGGKVVPGFLEDSRVRWDGIDSIPCRDDILKLNVDQPFKPA